MGRIKKIAFDKFDPPSGSILFDIRYYEKPEVFELIYRDSMTKRLEREYIEPIIDIWFLKPEERTNKYQLPQVEMARCYPVYCKPSQIPKVIAENIGGEWEEKYNQIKDSIPLFQQKSIMCECPWVFKADFLPDVYLRLQWMKRFGSTQDLSNISFGMLDIEVDVIDQNIEISNIDVAPVPINAATLILPEQQIVAVFVLGPRPKHTLQTKHHQLLEKQIGEWKWLLQHQDEFINIIKGNEATVQLEHYSISFDTDNENKKYIGDYDIRLHLFDYEQEIGLIGTMFAYIHKYRPMFMFAWNATFDDNYIMKRLEYLGVDPREVWIPEDFQTNMLYFKADKSKNFSLKTSRDWLYCSSYTQHACHLRTFAAIRKSQSERRSYSLSSVGKDIAKIDKLTSTKSGSFRTFAYSDFLKFVLYNVRDVVVELAIELICRDSRSIASRSYMFATQYSKCFQETHIVRNMREWFYEQQGYVQACRLIIDESDTSSSFKGAYVAPPENNASTGLILLGKEVNYIIYGALDADAASYYPSTKMAENLDPMSLLFKCVINNNTFISHQSVNRSFNQEYTWTTNKGVVQQEDMSGPIFNAFKNKNIFSMMYNWMGTSSITDIFEYLDMNL